MEWISEGKAFKGLLDTGVGVSAQHRWPLAWLLDATTTDLQGVSSVSHPSISVKLLTWKADAILDVSHLKSSSTYPSICGGVMYYRI